jgi:multiple sugar transport system permease protein
MSQSKKSLQIQQIAKYLLLSLFLLWVLIPIYMVFQNSIKPTLAIFADPPQLIFTPTTEHYIEVFTRHNMSSYMLNSLIVALSTMVISLFLGSLAAYSFARLRLRGKEHMALLVLISRMVPAIVLVVPIFTIMRSLKLTNTYWSIIIAHTTFNLPFVVWMMRSFFEEIPEELEDAAMVDGCSRLGAFRRVALPLAAPGLAATAILCLLLSWNEFLFALVLSGKDTRTLPIGISAFIGTVSIDWGASSAAAVVAMVPIFILGLMVQRYLVRGLTMGAVKG